MLDGVPCSSSATCYAVSQPVAVHNTNGVMTKVSSYWKDTAGRYLSFYKDYWETTIANFGTWNSVVSMYYRDPVGAAKQIWSTASNTCNSSGISWRLPAVIETSANYYSSSLHGTVGGVPAYLDATYSTWTSTPYRASHYHLYTSNILRADGDSYPAHVRCVR